MQEERLVYSSALGIVSFPRFWCKSACCLLPSSLALSHVAVIFCHFQGARLPPNRLASFRAGQCYVVMQLLTLESSAGETYVYKDTPSQVSIRFIGEPWLTICTLRPRTCDQVVSAWNGQVNKQRKNDYSLIWKLLCM